MQQDGRLRGRKIGRQGCGGPGFAAATHTWPKGRASTRLGFRVGLHSGAFEAPLVSRTAFMQRFGLEGVVWGGKGPCGWARASNGRPPRRRACEAPDAVDKFSLRRR